MKELTDFWQYMKATSARVNTLEKDFKYEKNPEKKKRLLDSITWEKTQLHKKLMEFGKVLASSNQIDELRYETL